MQNRLMKEKMLELEQKENSTEKELALLFSWIF